jgi:hypothetical protein
MFRNWKMREYSAGRSDSYFFRLARHYRDKLCMSEGQADPSIHEAKHFSDNIQGVASAAPPVVCIERISRSGADDSAAFISSQQTPKCADPPSVRLGGNDNDDAQRRGVQCSFDGNNFISGVENWRFQHVNGGGRHAFVNQDFGVVIVFARIFHANFFHRFTWLHGMGEPDFRCVAFAIKFGSLENAIGHASAKHSDGLGTVEGVFDDEPLADVKKTNNGGYE